MFFPSPSSPSLHLLLVLALSLGLGCSTRAGGDVQDDDDSATADDDDDTSFSCDGITPEVTEIGVTELVEMMQDKDFDLINVHIPRAGEIPGTDVHVPYDDIDALEQRLDNDPATKAVLYCRSGSMSAIATADLVELGYCRIYDMTDAMNGWEAAGYTLDP